MGSTVPHDEQSAREYLRSSRGAREASDLIAHAATRSGLIRAATKLNYWPAQREEMRAVRKVAHVLYPGEDIPPPERGRPPDDLALFARSVLKFSAAPSARPTARELLALALIFGIEETPRIGSRGWDQLTPYQREGWKDDTVRKWEVLHTRNSP